MNLETNYKKHRLRFRFLAGTSRGTLSERDTFIIFLKDLESGEIGMGEASPLKGLSIDFLPEFENRLIEILDILNQVPDFQSSDEILAFVSEIIPASLPAIKFGIETALLDLFHGGNQNIFENSFYFNQIRLPINGLIWMGDEAFMRSQLDQKLEQGFQCIKMKIGAIDVEKELSILKEIRDNYDEKRLTLRVDANGAFEPEKVRGILKRLSLLGIHSIEQPIMVNQHSEMAALCDEKIIPIALDEELIGVHAEKDKVRLIDEINPQYLILKPTLLGGFKQTMAWIHLAEERGIGWWITSALESNIGLNAICQFTAMYTIKLPQGLGTGQLYHNNFPSPLTVENGVIYYNPQRDWDLSLLS